jgi:hypothetical protein
MKKLASNIAGIAFLLNSGAALADEPIFMPDNAFNLIQHLGVNPNNLQWDELRLRDMAGDQVCRDRDENGIADTEPFGRGERVERDTSTYTLVINIDDYSGDIIERDVTRGEAVLAMQGYASGMLLSNHGMPDGEFEPVMIISRHNGTTQIARPLSVKPVGELGTGYKLCNDLKLPAGMN